MKKPLKQFVERFGTHHYQIDVNFRWPEAADYITNLLGPDFPGEVLTATAENGSLTGLMAFREQEWDCRIFGYPVASIGYFYTEDGDRGEAAAKFLLGRFHEWIQNRGIRFASIKTYPKPELLKVLQNEKYYYVATEIIASRRLPAPELNTRSVDSVRYFREGDMHELSKIARSAPWVGRFHVDRQFPKSKADQYYVTWVENAIHRKHAKISILDISGKACGFIVWSFDTLQRGTEVCIVGDQELVAIDRSIRGQGYGKMLYCGVLKHMEESGVQIVKTTISAINAPALTNQARLGFSLNYSVSVFHRFF